MTPELENFRNPWTESDLEKLLTLKDKGKTYAQISKILGRTESAVTAKAYHLRQRLGKKSQRWTHEETEDLIALAETLPRTQLLLTYNKLAAKKGYRERTMASVCRKLFELGQSVKPQSGWYGTSAIAIGLGFSLTKIHSWLQAGLKHHAEGKHCFYVRNDNLVRFILDHPICLKGISEDGLQWFLALIKEVQEMKGHEGRPEYTRSLTA